MSEKEEECNNLRSQVDVSNGGSTSSSACVCDYFINFGGRTGHVTDTQHYGHAFLQLANCDVSSLEAELHVTSESLYRTEQVAARVSCELNPLP